MAEYDVLEAEGVDASFPVYQSTKIEMGNLVSLNAAGYLIESTDTASTQCVGIAMKTIDNSSGSDGDLDCPVRAHRRFRIKNSATANAITTADGRCLAYVEDSGTVVAAAGSTNKVIVGVVDGEVTANYVWVWVTAPGLYATAAAADLTVGQDLTVTRDATVGRNVSITGTLAQTGVATFTAADVHSGGLSVAAGKAVTGSGALTVGVAAGAFDLTLKLGDAAGAQKLSIVDSAAAEQASINSDGAATFATGMTVTKGNILATEGNITATKGNIVATEGNVTLTKGSLTLTDGDLTMTQGIFKMVGVTANDGMQIGYAAAAISEPPKLGEMDSTFGAKAVGRNGFIGTVYNSGGANKCYLVGIAAGAWYQQEFTACGA